MKTLTVTAWRRPEYLRAVLLSLRHCVGISGYKVWVVIDHGCLETVEVAAEECEDDWGVIVATHRRGCNASIRMACEIGFAHGDYHVHLEDDCLPAKDCLSWFEWARGLEPDESVFTVSAYSKTPGSLEAIGRRSWFTGWGWATWRSRWEQMLPVWPEQDTDPWDVAMCHRARRFRYEVHPVVARVQNIGRDAGFNVNPGQWLEEQYNANWAGESTTRVWA